MCQSVRPSFCLHVRAFKYLIVHACVHQCTRPCVYMREDVCFSPSVFVSACMFVRQNVCSQMRAFVNASVTFLISNFLLLTSNFLLLTSKF